jgi:hypothetical protein
MNLHKLLLAGVLFAFAAPVAALAQSTSTQSATVTAQTAALNALTSEHQTQVRNILSLLHSGQMDKSSAAVQIDAVLSDDESKAVLAEAAKIQDDATDAGVFLAE